MRRRDLLALIGGATFARPPAGAAQTAKRIWRLGVLSPIDAPLIRSTIIPELARPGFIEGQNLVIDTRIGGEDQLTAISRRPSEHRAGRYCSRLQLSGSSGPAGDEDDPHCDVADRYGPGCCRRRRKLGAAGGDVTGVTLIAPDLEIKRFELLREIVPAARRIALLSMHREVTEPGSAPTRTFAAKHNIQLTEFYVDGPGEFDKAFEAMRSAGAEALVLVPVPEFSTYARSLADLALKAGLPTVCGGLKTAEQGCLLQYGPDPIELSRFAADYVARILAGASPSELPIQGPTHYVFAVNIKTANALGLTIPPSLLARADEVIEWRPPSDRTGRNDGLGTPPRPASSRIVRGHRGSPTTCPVPLNAPGTGRGGSYRYGPAAVFDRKRERLV